jgi:glutaminyl-tRNA synthetase
LNFGIADKFSGTCNLRFDDTNPASEKQEFIDSIQEDVRWLGFQWDGPERYASDYFDKLYAWAETFIENGWAYVDELTAEEISEYRGSITSPGKDSPYRARPADESLDLLRKMRSGQIDQGKAVVRAKIDMAHHNVIMRDPIMYRILNSSHPRTGDAWCIYPSYDYAHGLSDAIEGVTHSVCTLEFSAHNELYDWFNQRVMGLQGALECEALPRQHEFARLEMTNVVVSKRKLKRLVDEGVVDGWDDPRMPTLSGMRRRGYPACALRKMCQLVGVTKDPNAVIQFSLLESCVRDALEEQAKARLLCVLRPLKVSVTNWEGDDQVIEVPAEEGLPVRRLTFGRELLMESEDFMEVPSAGFKRLSPGGRVKLRYGYVLTCDEVVKDEAGTVTELKCSYDPESLGQRPPKKVAVVHWAHATASVPVRARLYDKLFSDERPEEREDFMDAVNPGSLEVLEGAMCEPCVTGLAGPGAPRQPLLAQFERCGYFVLDEEESRSSAEAGGPLVFNRAAGLREAWARKAAPPQQQRGGKKRKDGKKKG